jgi:hypothetical protein
MLSDATVEAHELLGRALRCARDSGRWCADFTACLYGGHDCQSVPASGYAECSGNVHVSCSGRGADPVVTDCSALGERCNSDPLSIDSPCLTGRACTEPNQHCEGAVRVICSVDGKESKAPCAADAECVVVDRGVWCRRKNLGAIAGVGRGFCDRGTYYSYWNGREHRNVCPEDCSLEGCVRFQACDEQDTPRCEGNILMQCVDRQLLRVDCATVGARHCRPSPSAFCAE